MKTILELPAKKSIVFRSFSEAETDFDDIIKVEPKFLVLFV